jgi:ion channel-forming bestrophin family protein
MHVGKQFNFLGYFLWTKRELFFLLVISSIPVIFYYIFHLETFLKLPRFVPTILGTAVAFLIAFKNNAAYARYTEGLSLYEKIQAVSYLLALQLSSVKDKKRVTHITNQHIAWLIAMRYQLREEKEWENLHDKGTYHFMKQCYRIPERDTPIKKALAPYLSTNEINSFIKKGKNPLYFLKLQQCTFTQFLKPDQKSYFEIIKELIKLQEKCLRLKNAPYPRNLFSVNKYFLIFFLVSLPFALLPALSEAHEVWLDIPLSMLIGWVFVCLDKVGNHIMNPFEGTIMDVPITATSQHIEIMMKEICQLDNIPKPLKPMSGFVLL